jgi:hypothetical protein
MSAFHPFAYSNWTSRMGRRQFLGAAAAAAVLPARPLWADVPSAKSIPDTLTAAGGSGRPVTLTAADIKDFRASMQGQLARRAMGTIRRAERGTVRDRHPALIARCTSTRDVVQAVNFARSRRSPP